MARKKKVRSQKSSTPKVSTAHPNARRYTPARKAKLVGQVVAGTPTAQVARAAGIPVGTLARWIKASQQNFTAETAPAGQAKTTGDTFRVTSVETTGHVGAAPAHLYEPSEDRSALYQALDEIREARQALGYLYLETVRLSDGSKRLIDRVLV